MSRHAFDFLESSLLRLNDVEELQATSDDDLRSELNRYREHVLSEPIERSSRMSVAVSAHQGLELDESTVKRCVLYFDDVMLPDPLFALTEFTRDRVRMPWDSEDIPRADLVSALRQVHELAPLVKSGRVRFIPSTHVLEGPTQPPVILADGSAPPIPAPLRDWFMRRARVRKVVTDDENRRLVLSQGPDAQTQSINIDFGQLGRQRTQDYMKIVKVTDDGCVLGEPAAPDSAASMQSWLTDSVNKAAADFLRDVVSDAATAWNLGASYVTHCQASAELLAHLRVRSNADAQGALSLELPMVEDATYAQIDDLLHKEAAAFDAFRFEVKVVAEALAGIDDPAAQEAEAKKASDRLARDQVYEVDRKLREATRKLKWNIPITLASLTAGALGFAMGAHTWLLAAGASLPGSGAIMSLIRDQQGYRALPGYFLWRLQRSTRSSRG